MEPIFRRLIAVRLSSHLTPTLDSNPRTRNIKSIVVDVDLGCKHTPMYLARNNWSSWEYTQHRCWEAEPSILVETRISNMEQHLQQLFCRYIGVSIRAQILEGKRAKQIQFSNRFFQ
ncbi:hypothetical protein IV203_024925 [Nitzschia inconspicua]|uniref:Uncharacterized protein n=1 Tax=Nitzschia inconspicua TaxID=303405 RepID=A0A9K3KB50_9STRA|nr:hypothetical protein IV203_024918 [Nitzschia inconspicua]KAG7339871.1 hypothetical protein IV203_024921 [Nitzschia inconspicua]KAG7339875.1 hypothetical protein IV203_024925 [Nitzschia inconspicua]